MTDTKLSSTFGDNNKLTLCIYSWTRVPLLRVQTLTDFDFQSAWVKYFIRLICHQEVLYVIIKLQLFTKFVFQPPGNIWYRYFFFACQRKLSVMQSLIDESSLQFNSAGQEWDLLEALWSFLWLRWHCARWLPVDRILSLDLITLNFS